MARLIVRNVGPINDVDIRLKKVNVLMGPQGCGKSTIAKIISFCSWLEKSNSETEKVAAKGLVNILSSYHRMEGYFHEDSQLAYIGDDISLFINYSEPLPYFGNKEDYNLTHLYQDEVIYHKAQKTTNPKVVYIPAERNFVSVVPNLSKYAERDDALQSFVNDWFESKRVYTEQHPLAIDMLGIRYYYNANSDIDVVMKGEQRIRLSQASSGFQSVVPLLALLSYLSSTIYEENKPFSPAENQQMREILSRVSSEVGDMEQNVIERIRGFLQGKVYTHTQFVIEEPEQNLFPTTQCDLVYHLLSCLNHGKSHRAIITTHSPYVLYALNNCLLANLVKEEIPSNIINRFVCTKIDINPKDVAVWEIHDGQLNNYDLSSDNNTIQDKNGLVRKNYFDSIMQGVMREFSNLLVFKE